MANVREQYLKTLRRIVEERNEVSESELAETKRRAARAFLEMWGYLDGFRESKEPMDYIMIENIFGGIDRVKISEIFKGG